jgi:hypothetical protein
MSDEKAVRFAHWVFLLAGIVGLIEVTPLLFLENVIGVRQPPPITHPEFYYGFVVIALTWQIAFLIIARDPARYLPLLPVLFLEKLLYPIAVFVLYAQGRVTAQAFPGPILDLVWLALFVTVWVRLRRWRPGNT